MGIKKYIIASLLLIGLIAGYVFSIEDGTYAINVLEKSFTLPIAAWVVIPAILLFIATLVHMMFYGLRNYFITRALQKDSENLLTLINKRLLNETSSQTFKDKTINEIANTLKQTNLTITNSDFTIDDKNIQQTAKNIININGGKYVPELKLDMDNVLMQKNLKNKIDIDENFALDVLKKSSTYPEELVVAAFQKVLDTKSMTTIKKLLPDLTLNIEMFKALVKKDSQEDSQFVLENETLLKLISKLDLTNDDLIEMVRTYKQSISPERLIKLFEDIITQDEKYTPSYLYVLSEYEMIDTIREILVNTQKDEYSIYKAYLDLRDAGKHYSLDTFI